MLSKSKNQHLNVGFFSVLSKEITWQFYLLRKFLIIGFIKGIEI